MGPIPWWDHCLGWENLDEPYLWTKFQVHRIILTPSTVGPKFIIFTIFKGFYGFSPLFFALNAMVGSIQIGVKPTVTGDIQGASMI